MLLDVVFKLTMITCGEDNTVLRVQINSLHKKHRLRGYDHTVASLYLRQSQDPLLLPTTKRRDKHKISAELFALISKTRRTTQTTYWLRPHETWLCPSNESLAVTGLHPGSATERLLLCKLKAVVHVRVDSSYCPVKLPANFWGSLCFETA